MLGLQEILIISAIIAGAIFIPRMVNPHKPAPKLVRAKRKLSGRWRMAIAVSVIYPFIIAAIVQPWQNDPILFLYFGVGPVAVCWLLFWVLIGYRRH